MKIEYDDVRYGNSNPKRIIERTSQTFATNNKLLKDKIIELKSKIAKFQSEIRETEENIKEFETLINTNESLLEVIKEKHPEIYTEWKLKSG